MIRRPVVAGMFYPGDPVSLRQQIENFLDGAEVEEKFADILGIISPHAGYIYSGQCAAYGFKALQQKEFELAVVIAPSHRTGGFPFSIGDYESYITPLGAVEVDRNTVSDFLALDGFDFHPAAHSQEHSLEVQLPFLQVINPQARILPIVFGNQNPENAMILAKSLCDYFADKMEKTVFIISSDLSHYHDSGSAEKMDLKLAEFVQKNQIDSLTEHIGSRDIEACGFGGILTLMIVARLLKYDKIRNLKYTHSGAVSQDYHQVVGYLSSIFFK